MVNHDCKRCEFMHHQYENSPCPREDGLLRDLAFMDGQDGRDWYRAIDECLSFEHVRAPMSYWTKKEILRVCQHGGASPKTMKHLENIKLEDLKIILLKKLAVEPRGMYSEIWKEIPSNWEHVRHTQMWGIDWDLIDKWNKIL